MSSSTFTVIYVVHHGIKLHIRVYLSVPIFKDECADKALPLERLRSVPSADFLKMLELLSLKVLVISSILLVRLKLGTVFRRNWSKWVH